MLDKLSALFMKCVHTIFNGLFYILTTCSAALFFISNKVVKNINQNKVADLELLQIWRPNFQFLKIKIGNTLLNIIWFASKMTFRLSFYCTEGQYSTFL